jgi:hypothetical protein
MYPVELRYTAVADGNSNKTVALKVNMQQNLNYHHFQSKYLLQYN